MTNEVSYKSYDIIESEIFPKVSFHLDFENEKETKAHALLTILKVLKTLNGINRRTETASFIFIVLLFKKAPHKYFFHLGIRTIQ